MIEEINACNTKALRKFLKIWRINTPIPVLIIQILKIFWLNLNMGIFNPSRVGSSSHPGFLCNYTQHPQILQLEFVYHPVIGLLILQFKVHSLRGGYEE